MANEDFFNFNGGKDVSRGYHYNEENNIVNNGINNLSLNDAWDMAPPSFSLGLFGEPMTPQQPHMPGLDCFACSGISSVRWQAPPKFGFPALHTQPQFSYPTPEEVIVSEDYSEKFTTGEVFGSRDDAIKRARQIVFDNHFCITIGRDKNFGRGSLRKSWLLCEKAGIYIPKDENRVRQRTRSKKCDCPFRLLCQENPRDSYTIKVVVGTHNHVIGDDLYGHALAGRMTPEQKKLVKVMTENHSKPSKIATTLNHDPNNCTKMKQVYNEVYNVRHSGMEGRTVVQEFFHKCKENNYFVEHRSDPTTNKIADIFFTSPDSMKLLKTFPYVLLLNSTYSTNRSHVYMEEL